MKFRLLILLALTAATPLRAQSDSVDDRTGQWMERTCGAFKAKMDAGVPADHEGWECIGYVIGAADALKPRLSEIRSSTRPTRPQFCMPSGVTQGQLILIVLKYTADHPEQLHRQAVLLIEEALVSMWPCRR